jgi:hypothetical protein
MKNVMVMLPKEKMNLKKMNLAALHERPRVLYLSPALPVTGQNFCEGHDQEYLFIYGKGNEEGERNLPRGCVVGLQTLFVAQLCCDRVHPCSLDQNILSASESHCKMGKGCGGQAA